MNITVQITGLGDLAESINNLAEALRAGVKADEVIKTASRKAKKTEQTTPAPAPEVPAPVDTQPAVEETKAAEPETASASPSKADAGAVKAALLALVKAKGHPAGAELLKEFGANKISDIKEADFEAFIEAAAKALA